MMWTVLCLLSTVFLTVRTQKNSSNPQKNENKTAELKKEDNSTTWIIVSVSIVLGLIILVVLIVGICCWRRKKRQKQLDKERERERETPSMKVKTSKEVTTEKTMEETPLKEESTQMPSSSKERASGEEGKEKKTERTQETSKEIPLVVPTQISKTKRKNRDREQIKTGRSPRKLYEKNTTPEYWKEDSGKVMENTRNSTDAISDATLGWTNGRSGAVKLFEAKESTEISFMETNEMKAQNEELAAALNRKRLRLEMTQSSERKKVAATLRTRASRD